jgi:20S proteasome alpha/beta subunit
MNMLLGSRRFEVTCDMLDVTSLSRPDERWTHTDSNGHEHYWTLDGVREAPYRYDARAELPTLELVEDEPWYDEDGEMIRPFHYECTTCRDHVRPGRKADEYRQMAPGLKRYTIDGETVSPETFKAEAMKAAGSGLVSNQPACLREHVGIAYAGALLPRPARKPLSRLRPLKERHVTVCIAAISDTSGMIVTASDRMVSYGFTSAETAMKVTRIHDPFWVTMLAGDDIGRAETVVRLVRANLKGYEKPSVVELLTALDDACTRAKNQVAEAAVLSPLGLDLKTFYDSGRDKLGDAIFTHLFSDIQTHSRLGIELLVLGYDEYSLPALLKYDDVSGWREVTRVGFAAIGSGSISAESSLSFHKYNTTCPTSDAVYRVTTAKFMSERADGVGIETFVMCLNPNGETCFLISGDVDAHIRNIWNEIGRPRLPKLDDVKAAIGPLVSKERFGKL